MIALALAAGIHAAVFLLLSSKYLETRSPYVAWWGAGAAVLAARTGLQMWMLTTPGLVPLMVVQSGLGLAGTGFFLTGSVARDPRARGIVLAGVLGFGVLVFAAVALLLVTPGNIGIAALISGLASGAAFLLAAQGYRRGEQVLDDIATRVIYAALIALGLNFIGWAWMAQIPPIVAASGSLEGLCMLVFGAGIELRSLQRGRRLVILSQISATVQRGEAVEDLLDEVLQRAGDLLRLHSGWVFLRNPHSGVFELAAAYRLPSALERDDRAPMQGSCRCLELLQANELTEPVNVVQCMRLQQAGTHAQHASVPLRSFTGTIGMMNLMLPSGRLFSQSDLALLATVGGEVGLAVEKARLLDELREKERSRSVLIKKLVTVHEDERKRIARELHDETGQSLTALILQTEALRTLVGEGTPALVEEIDRLKALGETTLEEVRKLIYDLRPSILDDLGIAAALRWYVRNQLEPRGLSVDLQLQLGDTRFEPTLETALFRIAQEALWNVVKHAAATHVDVTLALTNGRLRLRIKDNGRGFRPEQRRSTDPLAGGMGLGGMEERAVLQGGTVTVTSAPDAGTEVVADFPVPRDVSDER